MGAPTTGLLERRVAREKASGKGRKEAVKSGGIFWVCRALSAEVEAKGKDKGTGKGKNTIG
jgi:hypothetical protein